MKRRIACSILLFIAISLGSVRDASTVTRGSDSVAASMRKLADDIFAAYQRRDTVALKKFYARQPDALFFWERKMTYSWEQLDATIDALVKAAARLELTTTDFRSGGSGDTGWFAATFHIERVTPDGKQSASDGRWTVVAERRDGHWLIVHEHTSFPLPRT
jgi:ketosteroid isomerase-like protein